MSDSRIARILIVDDEYPQMKALCDALGCEGYETAGFTSGQEALAALQGTSFDLLLTDLTMPGMDGLALLRAAQDMDRQIVGVVMTGHGTIDTAVETMKTGALDYILKPFDLSVALPVLSRALAMRRLRIENAELARKVQDRTTELEATNKALETFSYSVSHDLRAPLRGIHGFASILIEDFSAQMPAEAQRLVNDVRTSARQMNQLIDGLLRLSQLGRWPLSRKSVSVSALVQEVLDELRKEHRDNPIEVKVGDLPDCVGDPTLLRQVFVNLLSNAFKYTRGKEPAVVEIGCRQQAGEEVFWVRDNGAGFDMQYAGKLFGVFQRLHRADQFEGTGVGLSIVQRIIERHGGRVWAEAEVDKGAAFYFTIPNSSPPA